VRQVRRAGDEQPRPEHHGRHSDQGEHADPHPARHAGKPGELIRVGSRPAASPRPAPPRPGPGELCDRPRPAEQQEPGRAVTEHGLHRNRARPGDRGYPHRGHEDRQHAKRVAHRERGHDEQQEQHPQQQRHVMGGQQDRRARPEQRRRHVPGERGEDHARAGPPAPGHRLARGVRVQPYSLQPPPAQHGDKGVPALMRDRDGVPRQVPGPGVQHDKQRGDRAGGDGPGRRHRLGPGQPLPEHRHTGQAKRSPSVPAARSRSFERYRTVSWRLAGLTHARPPTKSHIRVLTLSRRKVHVRDRHRGRE